MGGKERLELELELDSALLLFTISNLNFSNFPSRSLLVILSAFSISKFFLIILSSRSSSLRILSCSFSAILASRDASACRRFASRFARDSARASSSSFLSCSWAFFQLAFSS